MTQSMEEDTSSVKAAPGIRIELSEWSCEAASQQTVPLCSLQPNRTKTRYMTFSHSSVMRSTTDWCWIFSRCVLNSFLQTCLQNGSRIAQELTMLCYLHHLLYVVAIRNKSVLIDEHSNLQGSDACWSTAKMPVENICVEEGTALTSMNRVEIISLVVSPQPCFACSISPPTQFLVDVQLYSLHV